MPYLMSDDGFPEHPKVDRLSDAAFRLHVSAMHYCARHLTDGTVPTGKVDRLKPRFKNNQVAELVKGGLWHEGGTGCDTEFCPKGEAEEYIIHDYLQWNKSRDWWEQQRARKAKNKADWDAKKSNRRSA